MNGLEKIKWCKFYFIMILLEVSGIPIPWNVKLGYGNKFYNPHKADKEKAKWQIKSQYNQIKPYEGPVKIDFCFHMPIPESTSKIRRKQMLSGLLHHLVKPDCTNMQKHLEDCIKGIVFSDDSQVVEITSRKIYSETPKSVIKIYFKEDNYATCEG